MAQARSKRRKDRARTSFMLIMLSVVLVFAFGLIIGKQNNAQAQQHMEIVPEQDTVAVTEEMTEEVNAVPVQNVPETVIEYHPATNFWNREPHVYLRVNHSKLLNIESKPNVNLTSAVYTVSDESIAIVDEFGTVTGVSKGECTVCMICGAEMLEIPLTVRELTVENGCTYVDGILIANKEIGLPEDYDPGMLPETEEAFKQLQEAAKEEGLNIYEGSSYRNYQYQIQVYNSLVDAYGEEYANRISAKPGYSEHQTGYTVDCNTINQAFIETEEGQWLDKHCHEYGFIIRYPEGKEAITGYDYECWHIRYLGVEIATEIWEQDLTLEEYLDVVSISQEISPTEAVSIEEMPTEVIPETEPEYTEPETAYPETEFIEPETEPLTEPDAEIIDAPLEAP